MKHRAAHLRALLSGGVAAFSLAFTLDVRAQPQVETPPETPAASPPAPPPPNGDDAPPAAAPTQTESTAFEPAAEQSPDMNDSTKSEQATCGTGGECEIDDLKTPASPAFSFIGVSPESVARPSTPRALALALYNAFGGNYIPGGFALEVAPCWLYAHPMMTYDEYRDAGVPAQLWHNLSASLATGKRSATSIQADSIEVGVGLRTHFVLHSFQRTNREAANEAVHRAEEKLSGLQLAHLYKRQLSDNQCQTGDPRKVCVETRQQLERLQQQVHEEALSVAAKELQEALSAREALVVELAGALGFRTPSDRFKLDDYTGAGGWVTAGYESAHWNVLVLGRYTARDIDDLQDQVYFVDVGGRLGTVQGRVGLHFEALHRFVHAPAAAMIAASNRFVGTLELRVSDDVYASASFGKDAGSEVGKGGVIALGGISLQVGDKPKVVLEK